MIRHTELVTRYNNSFKMTFDGLKKTDNLVKIFVAPMGFGKTYNLITSWVPHAFDSGLIDFVVITAPKTDIVTDNTELLNDIGSEIKGVVVTTNVKEAIRRITKGKRTILYTTNQGFFVEKKGAELSKLLQERGKFAIFNDEFHTWSTSSLVNYRENLGHDATKFLARMYTRLEELAPYSPYLFAMTATPNWEVRGLLDITGELKYQLANNDAKIFPAELSARSAWMGNRTFYKNKIEQIEDTIKHSERQEEYTGMKNVCLIVCEQKKKSNSVGYAYVPQEVLPTVKSLIQYGDVAISTHEEIKIYDYEGNVYVSDDDEILEKLNDINDPLKYLLCVDKFAMGVNVVTAKTLCILKESDRTRGDGSAITENALQVFGRLLRPFCGMTLEEFYRDYGGDLSKVDFNKEMNRMHFFIQDTPMWRAAMEEFEELFVPPMFDVEEKHCPTCTCDFSDDCEIHDKLSKELLA